MKLAVATLPWNCSKPENSSLLGYWRNSKEIINQNGQRWLRIKRTDTDYKRRTNDERFRINFSICANRYVAAFYYFTSHQFWKRAIVYRGWRWTGPEVAWSSSWCQKVRYPFSCCNFGILSRCFHFTALLSFLPQACNKWNLLPPGWFLL